MSRSHDLAAHLVIRLLATRSRAHALHLLTKSYATHKALEFLYEGLPELTDDFAEVYQGCYSVRLDLLKSMPEPPKEPKQLVEAMMQWIANNRKEISEASHIQNVIDEIVAHLDRASYLLTLT